MKEKNNNLTMIRKLMFRLLPIQILLAVVGAVNGIVSSFFASNFVGIDAMSAVGLYSPINMFLGAVSTILMGGCAIICGKYLGENQHKKLQSVFSLNICLSLICSLIFISIMVIIPLFSLTSLFTKNATLQPIFGRYLLGQAIGVIPFFIGNQLPPFLTMENKGRRSLVASIVYIVVNLILNFIFVQLMHLEEFGLALASSLGMWVFMSVELQYFFSSSSSLKISFRDTDWKSFFSIFAIGFPGAASYLYQTIRGLIVNDLLETYVGSVGLSAFAAANNLMGIFWAIPQGMLAVSRLLISVSIGEEDRQTLTDVMRVMMRYYLPLMAIVDVGIIALSHPLTYIFFQDTSLPVFGMMASGLRILPLCMPFSIIAMHFMCYGQAFKKNVFVNILAFLDGVASVAGFSYILIQVLGIDAVYIANVLNGVVTTIYIIAYAWVKIKHRPANMEELMVIPDDFGVAEDDRIDISLNTMEEVVNISKGVQDFCLEKGVDKKRAYYAGLFMEEMAGNVVSHGFKKDAKKHTVDVRVAYKDDKVTLRIKDDCIPFDPKERNEITDNDDITKNIGIRMVYKIMKDIEYQNIFGLNVLTIKI